MIGADGHSARCTFLGCAHPESPTPCPFVAERKLFDKDNFLTVTKKLQQQDMQAKADLLNELADVLRRIIEKN